MFSLLLGSGLIIFGLISYSYAKKKKHKPGFFKAGKKHKKYKMGKKSKHKVGGKIKIKGSGNKKGKGKKGGGKKKGGKWK